MNKYCKALIRFYHSKYLILIIISFGILLRFNQYIFERPLWYDEILAFDIFEFESSQLFQNIDHLRLAYPFGFFVVERFLFKVFGGSEYSLRLYPFILGIISLFIFYGLAKKCISVSAVPIAIGLFSISGPLIHYSAELRNYSGDVAITLLLLLYTVHFASKELTYGRIVLFGGLGMLSIWFSFPAIFVLMSASIYLLCNSIKKNKKLYKLLILFSLWLSSFIFYYYTYMRDLYISYILRYPHVWDGAFMPFPPLSLSDLKWFPCSFYRIFRNPVGIFPNILAAVVFLFGALFMFKKEKKIFLLLTLPIIFNLFASALHKYPFIDPYLGHANTGRIILYIAPILILFIAQATLNFIKFRKTILIGAIIFVLLFTFTLKQIHFYPPVKPHPAQQIKPTLDFFKKNRQTGDLVFVFKEIIPLFKYYLRYHGLNDNHIIYEISNYKKDLKKLRNKNVWFFFFFVSSRDVEYKLYYLDSIGTRVTSYKTLGAKVYLYSLH